MKKFKKITLAILFLLNLGFSYSYYSEHKAHIESKNRLLNLTKDLELLENRTQVDQTEVSDSNADLDTFSTLSFKDLNQDSSSKKDKFQARKEQKQKLKDAFWKSPRAGLAEIVIETIVEKADSEADKMSKKFELEEDQNIALSTEIKDVGNQIADLFFEADDLNPEKAEDLIRETHKIGQAAEDRVIDIIGSEKYLDESQKHTTELFEEREELQEKSADDIAVLKSRIGIEAEQVELLKEVFKEADDIVFNKFHPRQYHALICVECYAKKLRMLEYIKNNNEGAPEFDYERLQSSGPISDQDYYKNRLRLKLAKEKLGDVLSQDQMQGVMKYLVFSDK